MTLAETTILDCGHLESAHSEFSRGYGTDSESKKHCYACCAEQDKKQMREKGKICLYLVTRMVNGTKRYYATNWPNSLSFMLSGVRKGRHNMAGTRYDGNFVFEGMWWHGVQYGENTQIFHCTRTKEKSITK